MKLKNKLLITFLMRFVKFIQNDFHIRFWSSIWKKLRTRFQNQSSHSPSTHQRKKRASPAHILWGATPCRWSAGRWGSLLEGVRVPRAPSPTQAMEGGRPRRAAARGRRALRSWGRRTRSRSPTDAPSRGRAPRRRSGHSKYSYYLSVDSNVLRFGHLAGGAIVSSLPTSIF